MFERPARQRAEACLEGSPRGSARADTCLEESRGAGLVPRAAPGGPRRVAARLLRSSEALLVAERRATRVSRAILATASSVAAAAESTPRPLHPPTVLDGADARRPLSAQLSSLCCKIKLSDPTRSSFCHGRSLSSNQQCVARSRLVGRRGEVHLRCFAVQILQFWLEQREAAEPKDAARSRPHPSQHYSNTPVSFLGFTLPQKHTGTKVRQCSGLNGR